MNKYCPCQSNKMFRLCCEPFLKGRKIAKTPLQLMRSRYTAYALGNYGAYLLETWFEESRGGLSAESLSVSGTQWLGLEIIDKSQAGNIGFVEFNAFYLGAKGETLLHHEKSLFKRERGRWFYVQAEL